MNTPEPKQPYIKPDPASKEILEHLGRVNADVPVRTSFEGEKKAQDARPDGVR